jgi:hypothetical protein
MTDEELEGAPGPEAVDGLSKDAVSILTALHASLVNYHLYPPSSDIVVSSVDKALEEIQQAIERWGSITFSDVEGKLLINDFKPEDREQAKANVVSFLKDISLWDIRSITFNAELREDDFRAFMEIFSRKRADKTIQERLQELLGEAGVRGIQVDEKIYVSLTKDQDLERLKGGGTGGGGHDEPVDMFKDEVFVRYLTGRIHLPEVSGEDTSQILKDPAQINRAFQAVLDYAEGEAESGVDVRKAGVIRDTVDRMYTLLTGIEDEALRTTLDEEMVRILSALDPGVLVDVLTEDKPEALKDPEFRREVVHGVEDENIPALTDRVIEKYQALIDGRDSMPPEDFADISAVLNELIDELYSESDISVHPVITGKLRDSGILDYMLGNHPEAGAEVDVYGVIADIRASGNLRALEGRSDTQIALIVRKLLQLKEDEKAYQIIDVASRNLGSDQPENRLRAIRVMEEIYDRLHEAGLQAALSDKVPSLLASLEAEADADTLEAGCRFTAKIANDLFLEREMDDFYQVTNSLLRVLDADDWRAPYVRRSFEQLHIRDVGRPLLGLLFDGKEENRDFAARILVLMDQKMFLHNLLTLLKEDQPRPIHPQLAQVVKTVGREAVEGLADELDRDNLEETYIRILTLLEMVGGSEAVSAVKRLTYNAHPAAARPRLPHPGQDRRGRPLAATRLPGGPERQRGGGAARGCARPGRHLRRARHRYPHQHPPLEGAAGHQGGLPHRGGGLPGPDPPGFGARCRRHAGPAQEEDADHAGEAPGHPPGGQGSLLLRPFATGWVGVGGGGQGAGRRRGPGGTQRGHQGHAGLPPARRHLMGSGTFTFFVHFFRSPQHESMLKSRD